MELVDWLNERAANCRRIAADKRGADRTGWLEDEAYFRRAAAVVAAANKTPNAGAKRPAAEAHACGCREGTCESKADRRCRMADEIAAGEQ